MLLTLLFKTRLIVTESLNHYLADTNFFFYKDASRSKLQEDGTNIFCDSWVRVATTPSADVLRARRSPRRRGARSWGAWWIHGDDALGWPRSEERDRGATSVARCEKKKKKEKRRRRRRRRQRWRVWKPGARLDAYGNAARSRLYGNGCE